MSVPSWFSVDTKLGSLAIHLTQSQAFDAEVYTTEAGAIATEEVRTSRLGLMEYPLPQNACCISWLVLCTLVC